MRYLLVVAHPDDEVLGAGASMWKWSHNGDVVDVAIMCTEAKARAFRPSDAELEGDTDAATNYVGVNRKFEASFPNIEMNTVPHLQLVQFIEGAIRESEPDVVIKRLITNQPESQPLTRRLCRRSHQLLQNPPALLAANSIKNTDNSIHNHLKIIQNTLFPCISIFKFPTSEADKASIKGKKIKFNSNGYECKKTDKRTRQTV